MFKQLLVLLLPLALFAQSPLNLSLKEQEIFPNTKVLHINLSQALLGDKAGTTTHKPLLECHEAFKAFYTIENASSITVYLTQSLKPNTSYSCQLKSIQSRPLHFKTQALKVEAARLERFIALDFNAPVSPNRLKEALKLFRIKALTQTALEYELHLDEHKEHATLHIKDNVSDDDIKLIIDKNRLTGLAQSIQLTLSSKKLPKVTLDTKRKSMFFQAKPRFVAKEDGSLAIRLYLPHSFYSDTPIKPFVRIDGVANFQVSNPQYLYYDERQKYKIPSDTYYYVDISGDFKPHKTYTLKLLKGLKDSYNYQLKQEQTFKVAIGDRKPAMKFESNKPYLSSEGVIGFSTVNMDHISIVVEKILKQNYRYFINYTKANPETAQNFTKELISQNFTLKNEKNRFKAQKISLKKFMDRLDYGVYRVSLHYKDKEISKTLFYSDIALSVKHSNEQLFIWATSLSKATPLEDIELKIYDNKNALLAQTRTNDKGVAFVNSAKLASKNPSFIIASNDKEQNFIYLDEALNGVSVPTSQKDETRYKSFTYLQSDLVRPGNEAKILFIIKDKNYQAASKLPVKVTIQDPSYTKIYEKVHTCSKEGAFELNLPISEQARTGHYTISVRLGKELLGSRRFSVENFIPQKIKNRITTDKEQYALNELLKASFSSRYLFGAPASSLKAKAKITALAKPYRDENYAGFSFSNALKAQKNSTIYLQKEQSFTLDAKGEAQRFFALTINQMPPSILEAQIALTVFDDGRGVSTYKNVTIFPYKSLVGMKAKKSHLEKNEPLEVRLINIDPKTHKNQASLLNMTLFKKSWHYYYDSRGYYKWEQKYTKIRSFEHKSSQNLSLNVSSSGDYTLIATNPYSRHSSSIDFSVRGWDYTPIKPSDDLAKLELKVDKKRIKKGDRLKVDIRSPLKEGSLLVTLESDKVHRYKVVSLKHGSASLDIDVDFETPQGLYVHATMVRSTLTESTLLPFRAKNSLYIKANLYKHRLEPKIITKHRNHSLTKQKILVRTKPFSSVLISLVDEGILQIKGQKPPKAFSYFERSTKERVAFFDIFNKVMQAMTKGEMLHFGGDDTPLLARMRKHLSPKTGAKRVKPFLFWSKILKADAKGEVQSLIPIPEFSGRAQIVAIAFDKQHIGSSSVTLTVKDDIIIKPTYPRFLHQGDSVALPVRIFNTTNKAKTIHLATQTNQTITLNFPQTELTIAPNSSKLIFANLHAKAFGKATVRILADDAKAHYRHSIELPITSAFSLATKVYKDEISTPKEILIDGAYLQNGTEKLFITLSDSYLTQAASGAKELIGYPYGCAEQTSSKLLALLHSKNLLQSTHAVYLKNLLNDRENFIYEGIKKLQTMQNGDGLFGYWSRESYVNPFASIYASDILLSLKEAGFKVPDALLAKIYRGLKAMVYGNVYFKKAKFTQFELMYASYLLSTKGLLQASALNYLYDKKVYKRSLVTHYMMAAMLKQAGETTAMKRVLSEIETINPYTFQNILGNEDNFYSKKRDLAFALYMHLKHFKKNQTAKKLLDAMMQEQEEYESTQTKAFVLRALHAYYKERKPKKLKALLSVNHQNFTINKAQSIELDTLDTPIIITPQNSTVNYTIEVSNYLEKPRFHKPLKAQTGVLKVSRNYVDAQGKAVDLNALHVGDLIYSKVSIQSSKAIKNVVISDRFASAFEIVNERLGAHKRSHKVQNSPNFRADYQDIRDNQMLTFLSLPKGRRSYDPVSRRYVFNSPVQTFYTPLRVVSSGTFKAPALVTEAMYDGRIHAYDKEYGVVTISPKKEESSQSSISTPKEAW